MVSPGKVCGGYTGDMPPRYARRDAPPLFPATTPRLPVSHADRGKAWEAMLDAQHRRYAADRWIVWRQHPPPVITGEGGREARIIGPARPDYLLCRDGVTVIVDAKSHAGPRWPLSEVSDHLAADLDSAQRAGVVAGIVLELDDAGWWLPWTELAPRWHRWALATARGETERGSASLSVADLQAVGEAVIGADWLPVALRGQHLNR